MPVKAQDASQPAQRPGPGPQAPDPTKPSLEPMFKIAMYDEQTSARLLALRDPLGAMLARLLCGRNLARDNQGCRSELQTVDGGRANL